MVDIVFLSFYFNFFSYIFIWYANILAFIDRFTNLAVKWDFMQDKNFYSLPTSTKLLY